MGRDYLKGEQEQESGKKKEKKITKEIALFQLYDEHEFLSA